MMLEVAIFGLMCLSVWRLCKLVSDEDGPFDFFSWFRGLFSQSTWVGRGIRCVWCLSFWGGLIGGISRGVMMGWDFWTTIGYGLAVSSLVIFMDEKLLRHE